ncbi:MAG: ParB N-terminal domain-containing protein [Sporolactobacillus sp.]
MDKIYTGKEICSKYSDLENDLFGTEDHHFMLTKMVKEQLYDAPCAFSRNGRNLVRLDEWFADPENYDNYHTDNVKQMIDSLQSGGTLPPLIIDKKLGLYDGQHRLTAYSMLPAIQEVIVYKEI